MCRQECLPLTGTHSRAKACFPETVIMREQAIIIKQKVDSRSVCADVFLPAAGIMQRIQCSTAVPVLKKESLSFSTTDIDAISSEALAICSAPAAVVCTALLIRPTDEVISFIAVFCSRTAF